MKCWNTLRNVPFIEKLKLLSQHDIAVSYNLALALQHSEGNTAIQCSKSQLQDHSELEHKFKYLQLAP